MNVADPSHSAEEERFLLLGLSDRRRVLVVAYAERGDNTRIISARGATRPERHDYEET
ncbi:MAG: BrnT family toxin [Longimicrobiales bacterium]